MEYVFPIPSWLRGKLLDFKRLYAYPAAPEKDAFILDSGAFALIKSGRRMDKQYLQNLYQYYQSHNGWKCAPDVLFDPGRTMSNFKYWVLKYPDCQIQPVIQSPSKKIEWSLIAYQLDFYREYSAQYDMLFFANPFCRAVRYPKDLFRKIRERISVAHLHLFGAGWDLADFLGYNTFPALDSIDSVAYCNAVNTPAGNWTGLQGTRSEIAIANAIHTRKFNG
jgi:hypothetical protein